MKILLLLLLSTTAFTQQDTLLITPPVSVIETQVDYPNIQLFDFPDDLYLEVPQRFILPFCTVEIDGKVMYDMTERKFKQCRVSQWVDITTKREDDDK